MRKIAVIALVVMASIVLVASALAESATKEECIAKCKEAAQLINEKGMDAAFQELQKKDGCGSSRVKRNAWSSADRCGPSSS